MPDSDHHLRVRQRGPSQISNKFLRSTEGQVDQVSDAVLDACLKEVGGQLCMAGVSVATYDDMK